MNSFIDVCGRGGRNWLAEQGWDRMFGRTVGMMLMGTAVITLFGLLWLAQFTGWQQAFMLGGMPFIPGDILKILLAAALLPAGSELLIPHQ